MAKDISGIWPIPRAQHRAGEVSARAHQLVERTDHALRRLRQVAERLGDLDSVQATTEQAERLVHTARRLEAELRLAELHES